MRILIVEDEHYAALRLRKLLEEEMPDAKIVATIDSVEQSVEWLSSHIEPNLIFMDIQLADGLSFQIFDKIQVTCPIIFISAYDEYALNAFKVNSIDYLLKPIEVEELRKAINKYQQFFPSKSSAEFNWDTISKTIFQNKEHYKSRFLIKTGNTYGYLKTEDITHFKTDEGISFAYDHESKRFIVDKTLDAIMSTLDPKLFFRISRKHIISLNSISKIHPYLNNRLKLDLARIEGDEFVVSREKVKEFKQWIDD